MCDSLVKTKPSSRGVDRRGDLSVMWCGMATPTRKGPVVSLGVLAMIDVTCV